MTQASPKPPTPEAFYIDFPLYAPFEFSEAQNADGWKIRFFKGTIDTYCPWCGSHSIFSFAPKQTSWEKDSWVGHYRFVVTGQCSRNSEHELFFLFRVADRVMEKIGQYPSLATLNLYDVRQYASVLPKAQFQEFTKAIGLAAHGVGVGSFVYLRRIFESLVEEAHQLAIPQEGWNESAYASMRMSERIAALQPWLPYFLVEHHTLYGLLSKGVHELSEDECLDAFPIVKVGIEIILDAKLRAREEAKKLEQARKAIQAVAGKSGT